MLFTTTYPLLIKIFVLSDDKFRLDGPLTPVIQSENYEVTKIDEDNQCDEATTVVKLKKIDTKL